jgi:hypothetical protein
LRVNQLSRRPPTTSLAIDRGVVCPQYTKKGRKGLKDNEKRASPPLFQLPSLRMQASSVNSLPRPALFSQKFKVFSRRGDSAAGDVAHDAVLGREHRAPHDLPLPFSGRGLPPGARPWHAATPGPGASLIAFRRVAIGRGERCESPSPVPGDPGAPAATPPAPGRSGSPPPAISSARARRRRPGRRVPTGRSAGRPRPSP